MKNTKIFMAAVLSMATFSVFSAHATSVSSGTAAGVSTLVGAVAAPTAAAQAAGIVASNIAGSVGGAVGGVGAPAAGAVPVGFAPMKVFNLRQQMAMKGGSAAADNARGINAWLSGGYTHIKSTDVGGNFDGPVLNANLGVDRKFGDRFTVGLTAGYENLDIDTTFNRGTFEGDGYSVGPYVNFKINNNWSVMGLVTYTWLNYDVTTGTVRSTGSFDAERLTGVATLNGSFRKDKWVFSPMAGVMGMAEDQDSYRDSRGVLINGDNIPLVRWSAGGTVGYDFGKITPYVKLVGEYDSSHSAAVDLGSNRKSSDTREGAVAGAGFSLNLGRGMTANLEGTYNSVGRENLEVYSVKGRLAFEF